LERFTRLKQELAEFEVEVGQLAQTGYFLFYIHFALGTLENSLLSRRESFEN
jgi:hypothetical protein